MGRVEWSALSGDEVETLLANLFYNRHERALRIRPSQGDYGIDLLLPVSDAVELWDVYQIKKFATNLDANQKGQIEKSFEESCSRTSGARFRCATGISSRRWTRRSTTCSTGSKTCPGGP